VELKDLNPVELAEYAVANKIQEEPAFKWWVSTVLRKRNRIIAKLKSRYWSTSHKFDVRLPKLVREALAIDEETGTTFWRDAIRKEMEKVKVGFEFCENWSPEQVRNGTAHGDFVGYQEIDCHMIFDVKMDLTRKTRFVAGGHRIAMNNQMIGAKRAGTTCNLYMVYKVAENDSWNDFEFCWMTLAARTYLRRMLGSDYI
jgi:hypothetical protein